MPADLSQFGNELKRIRQQRGIQQKQIINRVSHLYRDEGSYRRIERGERRPERMAIIELLTRGLLETDSTVIDRLLELAGYERLRDAETTQWGISRNPSPLPDAPVVSDKPEEVDGNGQLDSTPPLSVSATAYLLYDLCIILSLVAAVWLSSRAEDYSWFCFFTAFLYASLYPVSLLLESAYQNTRSGIVGATVFSFCFIILTSVAALALDNAYTRAARPEGFWLALAIFVAAAVLQWIMVRSVLPALSLVQAKFRPHTAQAAHLKNTAYFLLIVVFFWLPPFHCVTSVRRELVLGHRRSVEHVFENAGLSVAGALCPKPIWLWVILLLIIGISVPMGAHLLDSLEPHPMRNRYLNFFYARLFLYIVLSLVCLSWYSLSLGSIAGALIPPE